MSSTDQVLALYLHLARASHLRMQPMVRDKLLVLAGMEAEALGLDSISALCRHRILAHNARHLVRKWPTLAAAAADERFQSLVKQLRRRYSKEKAEHMLNSLGIELARERALYADELEYAAALLDTDPAAIDGILTQHPRESAGRYQRWPPAAGDGPAGGPGARQPVGESRLRHLLVVWMPFVLGLTALAVAAVVSHTVAR